MSSTFQKDGKTYTVVFALMHDTYKCLAKELTKRATLNDKNIQQLINIIDQNKGLSTDDLPRGTAKMILNEDGTVKRSEAEMRTYYNTLRKALSNKRELTIDNIKSIHALIFSQDEEHRGKLKNESNDLTLPTADPNKKNIIATTPPNDTPRELGYLIRWTNKALSQGELHPLIVISTFIYEFLLVHPFKDGNGRTSRILTHVLLARSGYTFAESTSIDEVIQEDKWIHNEILLKEALNRNEKEIIKLKLWVRYYLTTISIMVKQLSESDK